MAFWKKHCELQAMAAGVTILLSVPASGQQALPWYEPFNYMTGNMVGQGGWNQTGTGTANAIQVSLPSLAYAGLPTASGGRITLRNGSNYQDAGCDVAPQNSGIVYTSFILKVINAGNTAGDYFFHVSSAGGGAQDFRCRLLVRQGSTTTKCQLGLSNLSTDVPTWTPAEFDQGATMFLVVAYTFAPDVNDDLTSLWVNPPLGLGSAPPPTLTQPVLQDLVTLGRVGWRQGQGDSLLLLEVDELRVAKTWTAVAPGETTAHISGWFMY